MQSLDKQWSFGMFNKQIDVVVPRNDVVMTIRANQCASVHHVDDVEVVEDFGQRTDGIEKNVPLGLGQTTTKVNGNVADERPPYLSPL